MDPKNIKVPFVVRNPYRLEEFRDGRFFLSAIQAIRPYRAKYIRNNCWRAGPRER